MKRTMTAALVLSLLAGTSALAQESGDPRERRSEFRERSEKLRAARAEAKEERREEKAEAKAEVKAEVKEERRERRDAQVAAPTPRRSERAEEVLSQVRARNAERSEAREERRTERPAPTREQRYRIGERRDATPAPRQQVEVRRDREQSAERRRQTESQPEWLRNYRPGDGHRLRDRDRDRSRYDHRRWQRSYHASHRYRAPRYIYPSGWYLRVWSFGDRLPFSSWYSQRYYLDWWRYGLPRPPIGTEWVRMRDDAILVDIWSGRVLAVYYDLFW